MGVWMTLHHGIGMHIEFIITILTCFCKTTKMFISVTFLCNFIHLYYTLTCIRALYTPPATPAGVSNRIHTQIYRHRRHPWSLVDRTMGPHPLPNVPGSRWHCQQLQRYIHWSLWRFEYYILIYFTSNSSPLSVCI